ncbi:FkbM family methyltransferase [Gloeobacter morelensis]|uniref:FkbM family methyltransferase n=1 Tax=Gloeobacter morelensis MG652769 TaxID=2781736 RepID=A0ABY3PRB7_9CYAN|nr:FkbM family methyltransferase [Gloeobacter morelensis]UFP95977.1 FkbM family methyltransferase [Gloeobacter morelensis MG652769]
MLHRLYQNIRRGLRPYRTVDFGDFSLTVDIRDYGGRMYLQPGYWADILCPIQQEITARFRPAVYLDVGANYGFTALLHFARNPECRIIAVEPSPLLVPVLEKNLRQNKCTNYHLVAAICSDTPSGGSFALNPHSSQDNRVRGERGWRTVTVPAVTIDELLADVPEQQFVYIKIDTQGFESKVLAGGHRFFARERGWVIKMEFAPKWLRLQGTEPVAFLGDLVRRYRVVEWPKRTRFKADTLAELWGCPLLEDECAAFVQYIQGLAAGDGWCDLLIAPNGLWPSVR